MPKKYSAKTTRRDIRSVAVAEKPRSIFDAKTQRALTTLRDLAPTLHQEPAIMREVQILLERAQARAEIYAVPGVGRIGAGGTRTTFGQKAAPTGSNPQADYASSWVSSKNMPQGVPNARLLRAYADQNPWVRTAIHTRKQQIGRADIAVLPMDESRKYDKKLLRLVERMLNYPNDRRDSYRTLIEPVIGDILTIDRGCISKNMDAQRHPHQLYFEDGATIKIYPSWSGDPAEPRYVFEEYASTKRYRFATMN